MTLDEVEAWNQPDVWFENRGGNFVSPMDRMGWIMYTSIVDLSTNPPVTQNVNYGKKFRCWTSRPTDEQRKAVEWE